MNIVKRIMMGLIAELPLSLVMKLSDGRLTTSEIVEIARQVATVVTRVLAEEYGDEEVKEELNSIDA